MKTFEPCLPIFFPKEKINKEKLVEILRDFFCRFRNHQSCLPSPTCPNQLTPFFRYVWRAIHGDSSFFVPPASSQSGREPPLLHLIG
jgi:hypothetical protein